MQSPTVDKLSGAPPRWYNSKMNPDMSRQDATAIDEYSLTIEAALVRYEHAGHPRTARSIQRYCSNGHLDCLRQETAFGEKYLITPASVARHISQIAELAQATRHDMSRLNGHGFAPSFGHDSLRPVATTSDRSALVAPEPLTENPVPPPIAESAKSPDEARHVVPSPDLSGKYTERLEGEVAFLREEISTKNAQIKELTERSRETNLLVGGLQRMLAPLLGQPDPYPKRDNQPGQM